RLWPPVAARVDRDGGRRLSSSRRSRRPPNVMEVAEMTKIIDERLPDNNSEAPAAEDLAREQAIKQIERKRRFWTGAAWSGIGMLILVIIWAMSEYHNAGGWPTQGFSQSSGMHDVWNYWIVYPIGAWVLLLVAGAWDVYRPRTISENQIKREMERQARH